MIIPVPQHHGEVDVKSAYIEGLGSFAVKVASGFWDNRNKGLPSGSGMMLLVSAETGFPQAVLLDNGYLTDLRTALAGAVAAKFLAPELVRTLGVIGAGTQGRFQARALRLVRDFERLAVYDQDPAVVKRYASDMSAELSLDVSGRESAEEVVRESDVIVTCTPAKEPLVKADWLRPGQHITAMGSDSEEKQELDAAVLGQVDRIVCDRKAQCFRLGELHHAVGAGVIAEDHDITELGELTAGMRRGRGSRAEITVCDLTGVGVQDTAIALLAYRKAQAKGLGLAISSG
jgi:ornithine cyclodeaminase